MKPSDPEVEPVPHTSALPAPPEVVIEVLSPLVTEARLTRVREVLDRRTTRIVPVLEELVDPHNISAVLRTADAFGLQRVHVVEGERGFMASQRVSKGAHRWLDLVRHDDARACMERLHADGYEVFVASMDGTARPRDFRDRRVAMVFGNEHRGASDIARSGADGAFAIPMKGFVESLNVSVAAAIALSTARGDTPGDLPEDERRGLLARFLISDVRDSTRIVLEHGKR